MSLCVHLYIRCPWLSLAGGASGAGYNSPTTPRSSPTWRVAQISTYTLVNTSVKIASWLGMGQSHYSHCSNTGLMPERFSRVGKCRSDPGVWVIYELAFQRRTRFYSRWRKILRPPNEIQFPLQSDCTEFGYPLNRLGPSPVLENTFSSPSNRDFSHHSESTRRDYG